MSQNHHYSRRLINSDLQYHTLFNEHERLEEQLKDLKQHPAVDNTEMTSLKRKKLHIVDELERVRKIQLGQMN